MELWNLKQQRNEQCPRGIADASFCGRKSSQYQGIGNGVAELE